MVALAAAAIGYNGRAMQYRRLGRTGLRVSVVGLGSGGASQLGQRSGLPSEDVVRLVRRALELGVNHIDTAADYGSSEAMLGDALEGVPRDAYVLSTKFQPTKDGGPLRSPEELRRSLAESLRRLRTDHVDIFYLHAVRAAEYEQCVEAYGGVLESLRRAGAVRFLGVTEQYSEDHGHRMVQAATRDGLFDAVMVGYNPISPAAALEALPAAQARDVGVVIMCAVRRVIARPELLSALIRSWKAEGLLGADAVPDEGPLDWVLGPGVESLTDAAYQFAATHPAVGSGLTGTANVDHLEANVKAVLGAPLPAETERRLVRLFGPVGRNAGA